MSIVTGENEKEEIQHVEENTLTTHSLQDEYENENMPVRETAIAPILSPISQASTPCYSIFGIEKSNHLTGQYTGLCTL